MSSSNSTFKIVIAYETDAIAIRAKDMAEEIVSELHSEFQSWEMDTLAEPEYLLHAAAAASEADMIIVAARGAGELPQHVKDWIDLWLPHKKDGPTALVVLLDEEGESLRRPPVYCAYLRRVAERGNMDFFCNASHWTLRDFAGAKEVMLDTTAQVSTGSTATPTTWWETEAPDRNYAVLNR